MSEINGIKEEQTPSTLHYTHGVLYHDEENEQQEIKDSKQVPNE